MVDKIVDINLDTEESENYKWISIDKLSKDTNYGKIAKKIETVLLIIKVIRMYKAL